MYINSGSRERAAEEWGSAPLSGNTIRRFFMLQFFVRTFLQLKNVASPIEMSGSASDVSMH